MFVHFPVLGPFCCCFSLTPCTPDALPYTLLHMHSPSLPECVAFHRYFKCVCLCVCVSVLQVLQPLQ